MAWKERIKNEVSAGIEELNRIAWAVKEIEKIKGKFKDEFLKTDENEEKLEEILAALKEKIEEFLHILHTCSARNRFPVERWQVMSDYESCLVAIWERRHCLKEGNTGGIEEIARMFCL